MQTDSAVPLGTAVNKRCQRTELGELEERSRHVAGWLEKVERAETVPSEYAKEAFARLAQRERGLAERLKALREKLGWHRS
jgi:hypothetical protein